jgi:IclR family acetate operon transcriptional repressor
LVRDAGALELATTSGEVENGDRVTRRSARSQTVEKALQLLAVVAEAAEPMSLVALSRAATLDKTTTHRLATSLTRFGLLRFDPSERSYSLGMRLVDLGQRAIGQLSLPSLVRPDLEQVAELSNEVANLGIYDDGRVVFVDQVQSPQPVVIRARVGTRVPVHCTSSGKVLLAMGPPEWLERALDDGLVPYTPNTIVAPDELKEHLGRIQRLGYAIDDEEHRLGIRCAAAPIFDHTGLAVASISIAGPAFRLSRERIVDLVETLKATCLELSVKLGYRGEPSEREAASGG